MLLAILIVILLCGTFGGYRYGGPVIGGGVGGLILLVLIVWLIVDGLPSAGTW